MIINSKTKQKQNYFSIYVIMQILISVVGAWSEIFLCEINSIWLWIAMCQVSKLESVVWWMQIGDNQGM